MRCSSSLLAASFEISALLNSFSSSITHVGCHLSVPPPSSTLGRSLLSTHGERHVLFEKADEGATLNIVLSSSFCLNQLKSTHYQTLLFLGSAASFDRSPLIRTFPIRLNPITQFPFGPFAGTFALPNFECLHRSLPLFRHLVDLVVHTQVKNTSLLLL